MYELILLNLKTNKNFIQKFDSLYFLEKYKKSIKYSKTIKIISEFKNY